MTNQVVMGAMLKCSFGMIPTPLVVLPIRRVLVETPAATIADCLPMVNILPFGMCSSLANPAVATATAAALGALVPMPCIPVTEPWVPGSPTVLIGGIPALNNESICLCDFGGVIAIEEPGQFNTMIP